MKKSIILFALAVSLINCKNKEENTETIVTETEVTPTEKEVIALGCYVYDDKKSNIKFEITENQNEIKGNLEYKLFEKDSNSGTFIGKVEDSVLIGNYTFNSEGVESKRQVAFKINGETLSEGFGELNEDGTSFKNSKALKFDDKMILAKTDCK
jgi:hypothetical protein